MTDRELLETILGKLTALEEAVEEIKEDTEVTRSATNSLIEWADTVGVITQVKFPVKKAK